MTEKNCWTCQYRKFATVYCVNTGRQVSSKEVCKSWKLHKAVIEDVRAGRSELLNRNRGHHGKCRGAGYCCVSCGRSIPRGASGGTSRCPHCGGRVLVKARKRVVRTVKAN